MYGFTPDQGIYVSAYDSARFFGGYSTNIFHGPDHIVPILTGNLDTTPGALYEISYTIGNDPTHVFGVGAFSMSFGNFTYSTSLYDMGSPGSSQNLNFLLTANSPITTISFRWGLDNGQEGTLCNLSVSAMPQAVPEVSTVRLLGLAGCILLIARPWRRTRQKQF
jgi:hypothetical protein